jgi:predicted DNA-binding protein
MAKDLTFKLRLDAQDRERLDAVAANYSAPAATVIRILIKEKYDQIGASKAPAGRKPSKPRRAS